MPSGRYLNPQYGLRVPTPTMDKLKYIALYEGRTANKEIERAILKHIADFEDEHGAITPEQIDEVQIIRRS